METKDPGYYRKLMESIEAQPADPITEDKAQAISLAKGIKDYIEKAMGSQDPKEVERLLLGARNSMDDVIRAMQQGMVAEGPTTDHARVPMMETKEPGYYRRLMESIEAAAPTAAPVNEDKARVLAVAQAVHKSIGQALDSQDPKEVERLLMGARNSMEEVIMAIRQGGLTEMGYGSRGPRRGDTVQAGVGTTLTRHGGTDDEEELDIYITFTATITEPGYAGDRTDPGSGSEWEFEIDDIEIDMPRGMKMPPGEELTPEEKQRLTAWFESPEGQARAEEAANDRYDPFEQGDY